MYFSFDGGGSWTQPTYSGWTARHCLGPVACAPRVGPIGTLPRYYEAGLVSDGDPAVAFGPRPGPDGTFSWANGSRLYYANLTSNFATSRALETFRGFEAIAVSRTDDARAAAGGSASAWAEPVIISKQSATTFSDKEQIWADNASSSRFFGRVYTCWASFRSNSQGQAFPAPLTVAVSSDGGGRWTTKQVGPAGSNRINQQADGCVVRTDSTGNVYIFGVGARRGATVQLMYKSTDGGAHWAGPTVVAPVVSPGVIDPVLGRPVMDGIAGARVDLAGGPNVDIANGRPTGARATDELFMTWSDGRAGLNHEQLMLTWSRNGGTSWASPTAVALAAGDRPVYTAPTVSPDGTDLYVVHNSFTTPYRNDTTSPRGLIGEVRHANVAAGVPTGWSTLERSPVGDPRGSSQNSLTAEFLGDYVYAASTNDSAVAVWNDTRNAGVCSSINAYRASLYTASPMAAPNVLGTCPAAFGNSDIFGGRYPDPTP
ncbi:hypothetical protein F1D05_12475 [Kribbella qitaiheensis]|uniref:Exo-alpha-sialidase n=1 Tax=Kribbella qitaiheensis TaxID=1544730 RepID=A0A7G6WX58_9ACTN|nr:hypothetical protein [Kribbella qitaiheensis]QNE18573.1 hypothetical protein F1D05_12475 [Kribbella qitaiheensis]